MAGFICNCPGFPESVGWCVGFCRLQLVVRGNLKVKDPKARAMMCLTSPRVAAQREVARTRRYMELFLALYYGQIFKGLLIVISFISFSALYRAICRGEESKAMSCVLYMPTKKHVHGQAGKNDGALEACA